MQEANELVRVFSGTEIMVTLLKESLEEIGIGSLIQNEFQSGLSAGIGGYASCVDLYIQQSDLENAQPFLAEFRDDNNLIK